MQVSKQKFNILFSAVCGLGTLLFYLPSLKLIKLKYPESKLTLLTWQSNNIFKKSKLVDEVIEIEHNNVIPISIKDVDLFFELKDEDKLKADIYKPIINISARRSYILKTSHKVDSKYSRYVRNLPINRIARKYLAKLLSQLRVKEKLELDALLYAEEYKRESLYAVKNNYVTFCLGNWSNGENLVSIDFYIYLIDGLLKLSPSRKIILTGKGSEERKKALEIIKATSHRQNIINLVNATDPNKLMSVFLKSRLVVGQDTGTVHLASCLGCDILFLARNSHEIYWHQPVSHKNNRIFVHNIKNSNIDFSLFSKL